MKQLDLFEQEVDEVTELRQELALVKQQCQNIRRGLFARHNELAKMYMQLRQELDGIKPRTAKIELFETKAG